MAATSPPTPSPQPTPSPGQQQLAAALQALAQQGGPVAAFLKALPAFTSALQAATPALSAVAGPQPPGMPPAAAGQQPQPGPASTVAQRQQANPSFPPSVLNAVLPKRLRAAGRGLFGGVRQLRRGNLFGGLSRIRRGARGVGQSLFGRGKGKGATAGLLGRSAVGAGAVGAAATGAGVFVGAAAAVLDFGKAVKSITSGIVEENRKLAESSPTMAMAFAGKELQEFARDLRKGERVSASAQYAVEGEQQLKDATEHIETLFQEVKNYVAGALSRVAAVVVQPLNYIAKLIESGISKDEEEAFKKVSMNEWLDQVSRDADQIIKKGDDWFNRPANDPNRIGPGPGFRR